MIAMGKQTPEPVFGIIKSVLWFRQFLLRGLENVRGEWKLVTMAWNMKRMFAGTDAMRRPIERLVDAIRRWHPAGVVRDRLAALEQRRLVLEAEIASAVAPAPRLHLNLVDLYRSKVSALAEALSGEDGAEARTVIRSLVESVTLRPAEGTQRVEVRGELAAILALAGGATNVRSAADPVVLAGQVKMVAGIGFEPMTFRL